MSLNPPLSEPLKEPLPRMLDEVYVLRRDGCNLEMQLNGAPVERTGTIYLTSLRIVFVCDRPEEKFWGLDIPLATIPDADFNQPIFGANNLTGTAEPLPGGGLPAPTPFKIYFKNGGSNTFVSLFFPLYEVVKKHYQDSVREFQAHQRLMLQRSPEITRVQVLNTPPPPPPVNLIRPVLNQGFIDPNDPSVIYVAQPKFDDEAQRALAGGGI